VKTVKRQWTGEELYGLQETGEREAVGKTRRAPGWVIMGIVVFF